MRTLCIAAGVAVGFLLAASQAPAEDAAPAPVGDADLAEMSGGAATLPSSISMVLTNQTQTATNTNNLISTAGGKVSAGSVSMGANALSGYAGIGNIMINTGFQNNMQSNLSVAVNMAPAGSAL